MTRPIEKLGSGTSIKAALNAIEYNGVAPFLDYKAYLYVIDFTGRERGQFYYTKFTENGGEAIHSIHMPFSFSYSLGEQIERGEGLGIPLDPDITALPPEVIAALTT